MTGSRLRLALAALAVLILAGGGSWWFLQRDSDPEPPAPITGPSTAPDQQDAVALVRGLPAALAAGDQSGLSAELRAEGLDVAKALPTGTTVDLDEGSWHRGGDLAAMDAVATAPGEQPRSFSVVLVLEDGTWRISGTYAKAGS